LVLDQGVVDEAESCVVHVIQIDAVQFGAQGGREAFDGHFLLQHGDLTISQRRICVTAAPRGEKYRYGFQESLV